MRITDLINNDILMEADLAKLKDAFDDAKKELKQDIDYRIDFEKIKKFMSKYMNFEKIFDIKKKRISEIVEQSNTLVKFLRMKLDLLKDVKEISNDEITPLEDFLDDFVDKIKKHSRAEQEKYKLRTRFGVRG